jgi:SLOG in TRPM, prokaryote
MSAPFPLGFEDGRTATAVRVDQASDMPGALAALGLRGPRPVVVVIGGAGGLDAGDLDRLRPLFERALVPVAERLGAFVIDGGTDAGVMHLLGRARSACGATFPLIGVAAAGTVSFPGAPSEHKDAAPLDADHTHFVLVPGRDWGVESPWIARVGTELAGGSPSATVLVNGGEIAYADVQYSLAAGRPVLAIAGSGRTADELASAAQGGPADERAVRLAASGLVRAVDAGDPGALGRALDAVLQHGRGMDAPPSLPA